MKVLLRFAAIILFVFIAACAQKSAPTTVVNGSTEPETNNETNTQPKTASVSTTIISASELQAGKALFEDKCSDCHRLHQPAEYTHDEWLDVFRTMFVKAKLDSGQQRLIRQYVFSEI